MNDSEFLAGRKLARRHLGRVLILGLGVSGKACALYLAPFIGTRVDDLVIAAGASNETILQWAFDHAEALNGAEVIFDNEQMEGSFDLCIASPGISEFSEFYKNAKHISTEIISEVEFAWRESASDSRWIAITGTNGKTTTTSLTNFILESAGENAHAVGNIGDTCIEAVAADNARDAEDTIYVVETSSYQLASIVDFAPEMAVILGITPDHLTWHQSHENYANAKFKLLANMGPDHGVAVLDAVNDEVRAKVRELKAAEAVAEAAVRYIPIGTAKGVGFDMREACGARNAAFVDVAGRIHVAFDGVDHELIPAADLKIEGAHNQLNALAAASACVAIGLDDAAIDRGLEQFAPLEHRIEPSGSANGIDFYNDSKATNVDATLVAIKAFLPRKPIVLLGGRDKLSPLDELVDACKENAKGVICYGEAKDRFMEAFARLSGKDGFIVTEEPGMDAAFSKAVELAQPGDVVLLSPACASFDEFSCFEERGEHFKDLVAELPGFTPPGTPGTPDASATATHA